MALPLLEKSLDILPTYSPALFDVIFSYFMKKDYITANSYLKMLESVNPNHPGIDQVKQRIEQSLKA